MVRSIVLRIDNTEAKCVEYRENFLFHAFLWTDSVPRLKTTWFTLIHGTSDEISSKVEKTFDRFLQDKPQEWRAAEAESMPNSSNSKAIFPTHEKNPVQLRERCLLKLDFCHCFLAIIGKNLDCQQSCLTELGISVGCAGVGRLPWRRHVLPRDYEKNQGGMSFLWVFCDPNDPNDPNGFFKMFFCAVRWIWALQSLPWSASKKR